MASSTEEYTVSDLGNGTLEHVGSRARMTKWVVEVAGVELLTADLVARVTACIASL